ncbi:MAG TPA: hypothetical protein VI357_09680 [Mycobacteriales bacterium]
MTDLRPGAHVIGVTIGGGAFAEYIVMSRQRRFPYRRAGPTSRHWAWS